MPLANHVLSLTKHGGLAINLHLNTSAKNIFHNGINLWHRPKTLNEIIMINYFIFPLGLEKYVNHVVEIP